MIIYLEKFSDDEVNLNQKLKENYYYYDMRKIDSFMKRSHKFLEILKVRYFKSHLKYNRLFSNILNEMEKC